jgi:hypothetical protein
MKNVMRLELHGFQAWPNCPELTVWNRKQNLIFYAFVCRVCAFVARKELYRLCHNKPFLLDSRLARKVCEPLQRLTSCLRVIPLAHRLLRDSRHDLLALLVEHKVFAGCSPGARFALSATCISLTASIHTKLPSLCLLRMSKWGARMILALCW